MLQVSGPVPIPNVCHNYSCVGGFRLANFMKPGLLPDPDPSIVQDYGR